MDPWALRKVLCKNSLLGCLTWNEQDNMDLCIKCIAWYKGHAPCFYSLLKFYLLKSCPLMIYYTNGGYLIIQNYYYVMTVMKAVSACFFTFSYLAEIWSFILFCSSLYYVGNGRSTIAPWITLNLVGNGNITMTKLLINARIYHCEKM